MKVQTYNFVDWNGSVNDMRLNSLLLDDGLDGLVHMVVDVLTSYSWCSGLCASLWGSDVLIFELGGLSFQLTGHVLLISMFDFSVLNSFQVVVMLFREDFSILNRLYRGMIVILVNLLVNRCLNFFMSRWKGGIMRYTWGDLLMNGSIVLSRFGHKVTDGGLGFVHFVLLLLLLFALLFIKQIEDTEFVVVL